MPNAYCRDGNVKRLLLSVLACSACSGALADPPVSSIRVTGNAKVTVQPDRVQIDIGVTTRAPHSQDAAAQNARQVAAVLAAVKSATGNAAVVKTIGYSLSPVYESHAGSSGGEGRIVAYTAANIVQVTLDELARIGSVLDSATQAGANQVQGIEFTLRDETVPRAAALRAAAGKARAEADVLAQALNLKVVRVLSVDDQSQRFAPMFKRAVLAGAPSAAVATPLEAGTLEVSADVTLTVEVSPAAR
jgi:uncharacterized protein YggE